MCWRQTKNPNLELSYEVRRLPFHSLKRKHQEEAGYQPPSPSPGALSDKMWPGLLEGSAHYFPSRDLSGLESFLMECDSLKVTHWGGTEEIVMLCVQYEMF